MIDAVHHYGGYPTPRRRSAAFAPRSTSRAAKGVRFTNCARPPRPARSVATPQETALHGKPRTCANFAGFSRDCRRSQTACWREGDLNLRDPSDSTRSPGLRLKPGLATSPVGIRQGVPVLRRRLWRRHFPGVLTTGLLEGKPALAVSGNNDS